MKVIKRNGTEVEFDRNKIISAITKANDSVSEADRIPEKTILAIAETVEEKCRELGREPTVEDVQDMVESQLVTVGSFHLAKHYMSLKKTTSPRTLLTGI